MGYAMSFFSLLTLVLGGSGSDVLDYVSNDIFWQTCHVNVSLEQMLDELATPKGGDITTLITQLGDDDAKVRDEASAKIRAIGPAILPQLQQAARSPDPEVSNRARVLIAQLSENQSRKEIRRLFAIRTLGQMKKPEALPALRAVLLESKDPFIAEYAAAAIASIEGKPYARPGGTAAAAQADVWLLPANVNIVAQVKVIPEPTASLVKLLEQMPMISAQERQVVLTQMAQGILQVVEQTGNFRLHSLTAGVQTGGNNVPSWGVIVASGLYNSRAAAIALKKTGFTGQMVDGVEILNHNDSEALRIILPSDQRAIVLVGDKADKLPVEEVLAALKSGKGTLGDNQDMGKLIRSVDMSQGIWAAVKITDQIKREAPEQLAAFDTVTASLNVKDQALCFNVEATGGDAGKIAQAIAKYNEELKKFISEAQGAVQHMPALKPAVESLSTIKLTSNGVKASGSGQIKGATTLLPMLMFMDIGGQAAPAAPPAPAPDEKAPPAPAPEKK